jgi:hypothetical protein
MKFSPDDPINVAVKSVALTVGAQFFDLGPYYCLAANCSIGYVRDGATLPMMRDGGHFNQIGAVVLGRRICESGLPWAFLQALHTFDS